MQNTDAENVTLVNLGGGVAIERFDEELRKVMENIRDVNTDSKKARRITLQVDFLPFKDRSGMKTSLTVTTRLASVPPDPTGMMHLIDKIGDMATVVY